MSPLATDATSTVLITHDAALTTTQMQSSGAGTEAINNLFTAQYIDGAVETI